jgi:23S rRNA pseudouridine955/2504/2580 synthase
MTALSKHSVEYKNIDSDEVGQRLDNYLIRVCKGVPKSHLYRILRSGEVRVNSKRVDAIYRLQEGDRIRIPPIRTALRPLDEIAEHAKQHTTVPILYEDEALLAVNKPVGMAVHGGSGVNFGVIESLRAQRPQAKFLELAHRLDRETSGILLVGKKRTALVALHDMFRMAGKLADKRYVVLVSGRWLNECQHVRKPLLKYLLPDGERRVRVSEEGKPAHTVFRLLARWSNFSLLEAQLKTGRTHQIRVHLADLGFPILGDEKYGDFALNRDLPRLGLKRMALHAGSITFPHPITGKLLSIKAPVPADFLPFIRSQLSLEKPDYRSANFDEII